MRKCWILLLLPVLLVGCHSAETFETLGDEPELPVMAQMAEISVEIPDSAVVQVLEENTTQRLYLCGAFTLTVQTFASGDLNKTVEELCGFSPDDLQILETRSGECKRSDWVWTCAGEGGDQIGRGLILDDGSYHYCLTAMADASQIASLGAQWDQIFASFSLA